MLRLLQYRFFQRKKILTRILPKVSVILNEENHLYLWTLTPAKTERQTAFCKIKNKLPPVCELTGQEDFNGFDTFCYNFRK